MLLSLIILGLGAQAEIPAIVRMSPHFSGAIGGSSLTVTATAEPTTLTLGEDLAFTLTIENVRNPGEVKRPIFESAAFSVEIAETRIENQTVSFRYRLRPRDGTVKEIPSLRFDYYMPEAAEEKRLRTKYTAAISITVKPKPAETAPAFVVPERFRTLVIVHKGYAIPTMPTGVDLLFLFLLMVAGILYWRWRNPQGARMARLQNVRAVRRAYKSLAHEEPSAVFRMYLQERFALPVRNATNAELIEAWKERPLRERIESLFNETEAQRFGGMPTQADATRVWELILAIEEQS